MKRLPSYEAGLSLEKAAKSVGKKPEEVYPLNSNENLFIDRDFMRRLVLETAKGLDPRFYPKEEVVELRGKIARYLGIKMENIFVGSGSDQLIDLLTLTLRHTSIAFVQPTFPMYRLRALAHRADLLEFSYREDFSMPLEEILRKRKEIGMFFICSPNNPTGHTAREGEVRVILEEMKGMVVSDEAYSEISGESLLSLVRKFDNLIILRSFSKAFGMAGLRLGYAIANEELIDLLNRVQYPYPVTSFAVRLGLRVLDEVDTFERFWIEARKVRDWLLEEIPKLGVLMTPTRAIFSVISTGLKQEELFMSLLKAGYLTRKVPSFLNFKEPVRVTFGPRKVMEGFLEALPKII
jgi:histidinol-phosphate aminotransferase